MATRSERIRLANSSHQEVVEKRTASTKHFDLGGGNYKAVVSEEVLHFQDENGQWQEMAPFAVQAGPNIAVSAAPYFCTTLASGLGITFQVRDKPGIATIELTELNDIPLSNPPVPVLEDGKAWWRDVIPGVDIELRFFEDKAELFKHIKSDIGPVKFTFTKTRSLNFEGSFGESTVGWDSEKYESLPNRRRVEILRTDSSWVRQGQSETQVTAEEFTGRVQHINPTTRVRSWHTDVVYPVLIDASISSTSPSGESGYGIDGFSTGWYESFIVVGFRSVPSYTFRGGIRWTSIGIPQGATVNSADVQLYGTGATNGSGWSIQVELENVDNAAAFGSADRPENLTGITAGTAAPTLTAAGYFTITGLTAAFQSVLDRTGWASNNAMRIALNPISATGTGDSQYFDSVTTRPVLNITYNEGGSPQRSLLGVGT